jgi:hypothetical protein
MEDAYIVATQTPHYLNGVRWDSYTFEWKGSKYATAYISYDLYYKAKDTVLKQLPWPVKIMDEVDFGRGMMMVRKDVGWHLWWILVFIKRYAFNNRLYQHFKWRIIMTFEIWGLAYQPEAEITSWRNIGRKRK